MNALIIDDSELDRLNLSTLLSDHPEVTILSEAHDLTTAREMIHTHKPDLIFLDVHLGKEKGFSVLEGIETPPQVILTTSHPQYALDGYEIEALDYILKPVTADNLARSIARSLQRHSESEADADSSATDSPPLELLTLKSPLFFKDKQDFRVHPVSEVVLITTDRPYSVIHTSDGSEYLHRRSLKEWNETLPKETFLALDRSTMINILAIGKLTPTKDKHLLHFTHQGIDPLPLGPSAFKILREFLHG